MKLSDKDLREAIQALDAALDKLKAQLAADFSEPEISWDKIPEGALVEVWDDEEGGTVFTKEYSCYDKNNKYPHKVRPRDSGWKNCRPAPLPWLVYDGKGMPVHREQRVEVRLADGNTQANKAGGFTWICPNWVKSRIVAFRLVLNQERRNDD